MKVADEKKLKLNENRDGERSGTVEFLRTRTKIVSEVLNQNRERSGREKTRDRDMSAVELRSLLISVILR